MIMQRTIIVNAVSFLLITFNTITLFCGCLISSNYSEIVPEKSTVKDTIVTYGLGIISQSKLSKCCSIKLCGFILKQIISLKEVGFDSDIVGCG